MEKLEIQSSENYLLFKGSLDLPGEIPIVRINIGKSVELHLNLNERNNRSALSNLCGDEISQISNNFQIKITFYPNGNISCNRMESSESKLKQCFIFKKTVDQSLYLGCVALEEIQPMVFEAELVGVTREEL